MRRSIWAVVAGFLFIAVLSIGANMIIRAMSPNLFNANGGTTSLVMLCLSTVFVGVFATVGCYLTARLAPSHPMRHALILGALGLVINLIGAAKMWDTAPAWFHILNLLLVMPYAWFGGRLRENEIGSTSSPMRSSSAATA
jgi:hypothetical protein